MLGDHEMQVLGGARVAFAPGSFMQANFEAMDAALASIAAHVPAGSAVADLHCGVGTIGGVDAPPLRRPALSRPIERAVAADFGSIFVCPESNRGPGLSWHGMIQTLCCAI